MNEIMWIVGKGMGFNMLGKWGLHFQIKKSFAVWRNIYYVMFDGRASKFEQWSLMLISSNDLKIYPPTSTVCLAISQNNSNLLARVLLAWAYRFPIAYLLFFNLFYVWLPILIQLAIQSSFQSLPQTFLSSCFCILPYGSSNVVHDDWCGHETCAYICIHKKI